MKKLLTILTVGIAMTACNNSGESSIDSAAKPADTVKSATDSGMKKMDSMSTDSSKMKMSGDTASKAK